MSLADALNAHPPQHRYNRCPINNILKQLEDTDQQLLTRALHDTGRTGRSIADALNSIGHQISADAVQRHRRGVCTCDPR